MSKTSSQEWYQDEDVNKALEALLPDTKASVIAPLSITISQSQARTYGVSRKQLQEASIANLASFIGGQLVDDKPIAIPLNLGNSHWVSLVVAKNQEGTFQAFYNDSLGSSSVPSEVNAALGSIGLDKAINLQVRQQHDSVNCGPYTVENLVKMATICSSPEVIEKGTLEDALKAGLKEVGKGNPQEFRQNHSDAIERAEDARLAGKNEQEKREFLISELQSINTEELGGKIGNSNAKKFGEFIKELGASKNDPKSFQDKTNELNKWCENVVQNTKTPNNFKKFCLLVLDKISGGRYTSAKTRQLDAVHQKVAKIQKTLEQKSTVTSTAVTALKTPGNALKM